MLNLTTVALPNLIAHDLVIVSPMSSMSGYVTYLQYQAGVAKGDVNGPTFPGGGSGYEFATNPANTLEPTEDSTIFNSPFGLGEAHEAYTSNRVVESVEEFVSGTTKVAWHPVIIDSVKFLDAQGNELEATGVSVAADGTVTATVTGTVAKIAYAYDNIVVPQEKIPTLKAVMKAIPLIAKARRIAVYY